MKSLGTVKGDSARATPATHSIMVALKGLGVSNSFATALLLKFCAHRSGAKALWTSTAAKALRSRHVGAKTVARTLLASPLLHLGRRGRDSLAKKRHRTDD